MNWFTGAMLYVVIWWLTLFAVLPFGVRPMERGDASSGGWAGAPAQPRLLRKAVATTLVAALVWFGCYELITSPWISFRSGWWALPSD